MSWLDIKSIGASAFVGGVGGVLGSVAKEWWMENKRAQNLLSKVQLDLEVDAYKEIWTAISDLRNHARSLLSQEKFVMVAQPDMELEYRRHCFVEAMKNFHDAHNSAILTTERLAPFYPKGIKEALRRITATDMQIVNFYADMSTMTFSKSWFIELESKIKPLSVLIDFVEQSIRQRLSDIRVMK